MTLVAAYRASAYEADGAVARIGRRSPAVAALLARLGARRGGFVTAWNPFSRRMPAGWNRRALARLQAAARRTPAAEGHGGAGRWREAHLLLAADPRRIVTLARRFRQAAVVLVAQGRPEQLVLLRRRPADQVAIQPPSMDSAVPFTPPLCGPAR